MSVGALGRQRNAPPNGRVRQAAVTGTTLTVGLEWLWLPNEGPCGASLPRGRREGIGAVSRAGTATVTPGRWGRSLGWSAASGGDLFGAGTSSSGAFATFTVVALTQVTSGATFNVVSRANTAATTLAPFLFNSSGSLMFLRTYTTTTVDASTTLTNGQWVLAIGTVDNTWDQLQRLWVDYTQAAQTAVTATIASSSPAVGLASYGSSRFHAQAPVAMAGLWSRRLLRQECAQLAADPFGMLLR